MVAGMRIAYASDIHREKGKQVHALVLPEGTDVLVLAGDIGHAEEAIAWIVETFGTEIPIVYVPGNHEFWEGVYQHVMIRMKEAAARCPNVHLLMEETIEIDGWTFIGVTAWTDLEWGGKPNNVLPGTNDYQEIRWREPGNSYRNLMVKDTLALNERAERFIWHELGERDTTKCIVVTHHAPTPHNIHENYATHPKNAFYVNMWGNKIAYGIGPKLWFHGHTHSVLDYECGDTRVLCNAIGYPEHRTGNEILFVDV